MAEKKLEKAIEIFRKEAATPNNIFQAFECFLQSISIWNPGLATVLLTFNSVMKIGVNVLSKRKAEKRIILIVETIEKIHRKQLIGETNYEAALICPELFRNTLIFEDENRVIEHLAFIEVLFNSGKYDFDRIAEALRLVNRLSSMEYKLLKLVPNIETKWGEILQRDEIKNLFETQRQQLTAAFLSLINMNLVVRKLVIRHDGGPELGTINFDGELEYIRLSEYGELFLDTMGEIKKRQENS